MGPSRKGFFLHRFSLSLYLSAFRPQRGLKFLSPKKHCQRLSRDNSFPSSNPRSLFFRKCHQTAHSSKKEEKGANPGGRKSKTPKYTLFLAEKPKQNTFLTAGPSSQQKTQEISHFSPESTDFFPLQNKRFLLDQPRNTEREEERSNLSTPSSSSSSKKAPNNLSIRRRTISERGRDQRGRSESSEEETENIYRTN